jgi:hypothetical protein
MALMSMGIAGVRRIASGGVLSVGSSRSGLLGLQLQVSTEISLLSPLVSLLNFVKCAYLTMPLRMFSL